MAEEKRGIRVSPAVILQVLLILGVFAGWIMSYSTLKGDIKHLKENVTKIEIKYDTIAATRLEWIGTVHKIEVHLENIDTRLKAIEK
ncbi:hypothetical protein LCGC14_0351440 [marine sediment metagenome]|uniref:Uncharacterized protein n=1 Tax=marine sediment metagenome TaxID=412755 RepID=A0A0F9TAR8_9ZZZZ